MAGHDGGLVSEPGHWGEVRYARRANGDAEAREWLESQDAKVKASFDHLFRRISAVGKINNEEQFRQLSSVIWEFKRSRHRILCFQYGKCWWLTHYYPKKSKKCPKTQIERAETIRSEFIELFSEPEPTK